MQNRGRLTQPLGSGLGPCRVQHRNEIRLSLESRVHKAHHADAFMGFPSPVLHAARHNQRPSLHADQVDEENNGVVAIFQAGSPQPDVHIDLFRLHLPAEVLLRSFHSDRYARKWEPCLLSLHRNWIARILPKFRVYPLLRADDPSVGLVPDRPHPHFPLSQLQNEERSILEQDRDRY